MNLETFKARARRKLELPHSSQQPAPARMAEAEHNPPQQSPVQPSSAEHQTDTMTPRTPTPRDTTAAERPVSSDKFAQALSHAQRLRTETHQAPAGTAGSRQTTEPTDDGRVGRQPAGSTSLSLQALTGSPARTAQPVADETASDSQLNHLRSLLLGNTLDTQQNQVDEVSQRTQAGISALRRDMDARLTDLAEYVEQLEQSILNSLESHTQHSEGGTWALLENAEERFNLHEQRMDALDVRLTNTLTHMRTELNENRESDRQFLQTELADANARTDRLLTALSDRLDASITGIENKLSERLNSQSADIMAGSETTVNHLREQLGNLIDERIKTFNAEQTSGLVELRDTLLRNTQAINAELQQQTKEQRNTLEQHRASLETQFNAAIQTLSQSKVSHKELSQLLSRLADRITQL